MKKNDWILAGGLLLVGVLTFFFLHIWKEPGDMVRVSVAGEDFGTYPLSEDAEIAIGEGNRLRIREGSASMEWADCPDKLCIHQGAVSRSGETIVCLPNQVVIEVESKEAPELDGIAG